jgi:hypothetical protein
MRNILLNGLIVCVSIFVVLCLAEVTFGYLYDARVKLSSDTIWEAQNVGETKRPHMRFAGIKFREDRLPDDILGEKWTRVLFLGDSFTYGSGIDNDKSRFSDIVEKEINEELFEEPEHRIHIFNASESGSEPDQWFRVFNAVVPRYQPQHVFAIFFLRDGTPLGTSLKYNAHIIEPIQQKYAQMLLYNRSAFLRYFYDRFAWKEYTDVFKQMLISSYLGTDEERSEWLRQQKFLSMMADECRRREISFHLVLFPMLYDLNNYQFHDVENEIASFAQENRIPVYSLTPGFLGEKASELWVASNNQHPNERGHRIAATTLKPLLADVCGKRTHTKGTIPSTE